MAEIDWDAVDISAARAGAVTDLHIDEMVVSSTYARWEAGAEMTNYSGCAVNMLGYWVVVLELGHTFKLSDLAPIWNGGTVHVGDWTGRAGDHPPNPRTVLALQQILARAKSILDLLT